MFSYKLFMVIFLTCIWQSNEVLDCFSKKVDDPNTSFEYIKKLLVIDTGYESHKTERSLDKKKHRSAEERSEVRDEIYQELACIFVLDSCHFMVLIKYLLSEEGVKVLIKLTQKNRTIFFQDEVNGMLNILYHFGWTDDMNLLWLMYIYVDRLVRIDTIVINNNRRIKFLKDHERIYNHLIEFTQSQKCNRKHKYQKNEIGVCMYSKQLEFLDNAPVNDDSAHVKFIENFQNTINEKIKYIHDHIKIELRDSLFSITKLSLRRTMENSQIMKNLLVNFAEIEISWKTTYNKLHIISFNSAVTVIEIIKYINNGLNMFNDIMHYIILYTSWKYMLEINLFLPRPDKQDTEQTLKEFKHWPMKKRKKLIKKSNKLTSDSLHEIITILNLDEDTKLKSIVELFKKPPSDFLDVQKNQQIINHFLLQLKKINSIFVPFEETIVNLDRTYVKARFKLLTDIVTQNDLELKKTFCFEGAASFLIFCKYIKNNFETMDFKVIRLFHNFLKNYETVLE